MSAEQFLQFFAHYNQHIFPLQIVVYAGALAVLIFVFFKRRQTANIAAKAYLGFLWLWTGIVFFFFFFNEEGLFSYIVGSLFIIEGLLFVTDIFLKKIDFTTNLEHWQKYAALFFICFSLLFYYAIGCAVGHVYPKAPAFGVTPCPLTLFTLALLLLTIKKPVIRFSIVPLLWSVVTLGAVQKWHIWEDLAVVTAAVWTIVFLVYYKAKHLAPHLHLM
jgi:hypothetical protein